MSVFNKSNVEDVVRGQLVTTSLSGGFIIDPFEIYISRSGDIVNISMPSLFKTPDAAGVANSPIGALPKEFRPNADVATLFICSDAGVPSMGMAQINTDGRFRLGIFGFASSSANPDAFNAVGSAGFPRTSFTYSRKVKA